MGLRLQAQILADAISVERILAAAILQVATLQVAILPMPTLECQTLAAAILATVILAEQSVHLKLANNEPTISRRTQQYCVGLVTLAAFDSRSGGKTNFLKNE